MISAPTFLSWLSHKEIPLIERYHSTCLSSSHAWFVMCRLVVKHLSDVPVIGENFDLYVCVGVVSLSMYLV